MKIAVFCSANSGIDPDFFRMTAELGRWIGEHGHSVVSGGCDMGLMECVARAAREAGGVSIGVVPAVIERGGRASDFADVKILCDNLSDRKDIMIAKSDVIVALPGGVGTLDEIFTVVAAASIGYHRKRVILYNMKGFWNSLLAMLDDLKGKGVIRGGFDSSLVAADSMDDVARLINETQAGL